jgi:CHAT domain-containing protein/Tfp pilus assembly protein PilF
MKMRSVSIALVLAWSLAAATARGQAPAPEAPAQEGVAAVSALIEAGSYAEAETQARALLARVEAKDGPDSLDAADVIDALVESLLYAGKATDPDARLLAGRAVAIREKTLGPEHPDLASSLNNLASLLYTVGDYAGARPLYERALAVQEKALGPDHPDIATSLDNLASLLYAMGDYAEARPLLERALAINEKALGPEHPDVATSLNNLAGLLRGMGDYAAARPFDERALAINEKALGPEHPAVAGSLNSLAGLLRGMGDYAEARPLYERALAIYEKVLGPEHPDVATSLNNLAVFLEGAGDYAGARPLLERSLAIREKALGPEHPDVATSLNNLAMLLQDMGDYTEARPLLERALAIMEKALGPEHHDVANSLNNLAMLLQHMGDYARALPLQERCLAIDEKALGPDHPDVALDLNNLATLLQAMGDFASARPLVERALAIYEKTLGPEHPDVATSLNNLAGLLRGMGDYAAARQLFERSLAAYEKSLGPEHPDVAWSLSNLAGLHCATGETTLALDAALKAERIGRNHARLTFRALSERQALQLAAVRATGLDVALSVAPDLEPASRARAWDAEVRSRALVLDEIGARHHSATESPTLAPAAQARAAASQRLANLIVRGLGSQAPDQYRKLLDDTANEKEQAERALAEQSVSFREEQARAQTGLAEVGLALHSGEALVAYCRYARHEVGRKATEDGAAQPAMSKSVPSYLAFVLRGGEQDPAVVPLGGAENLEALVTRWREQVSRAGGDEANARRAGEELRAKAWDPITVLLGDAKRVFVVPDGALNLVSFAALPAGDQEYVAEVGPTIHYLSAERDLVPSTLPVRRGDELLAIGAPAFDETALFAKLAPAPPSEPTVVATVAALAPDSTRFRGQHSSCGDFATLHFAPLAGAEQEASEIAALWRKSGAGAVHLSGDDATEAAFKSRAAKARVIHLATHGFFLGGECKSALDSTRGVSLLASSGGSEPPPLTGENPLLLSGLALAGANHRDAAGPGEEDGILTAEEIASLDLSGVEWAVLSACDTGLGDIKAGEGVFGLRRAFQVAGAKTVIMSLWGVEDESARQWMTALYTARLERQLDTAECAREASLSVLHARRAAGLSTSPFYWAAFVAAGDPR